MALEFGAATIVLGFREEAWPKGHGYLYWRKEPGGREVMLRDCDLYEPDEDAVSRMLEDALVEVSRRLGIEPGAMSGRTVETENMSPLAQGLLRKTLERLAARALRAPQAE